MRRICKKLKSRGGASILFAILIFMLCALAGASALTAAAANVGRYSHLEDDQQKYLSVSSAIDLLRGQLKDQKLTASLMLTETYKWNSPEEVGTTAYSLGESVLSGLTGWMTGFEDTFKGIFENTYVPSDFFTLTEESMGSPTPDPAPKTTFTISGEGGLSGKVNDVYVEVSLDGDTFDLLFSFYVGTETDKAYVATMRAPATVTQEGPIETVTQSEEGGSGQRVTETTAKVAVTWRAEDTVVVRDTNG